MNSSTFKYAKTSAPERNHTAGNHTEYMHSCFILTPNLGCFYSTLKLWVHMMLIWAPGFFNTHTVLHCKDRLILPLTSSTPCCGSAVLSWGLTTCLSCVLRALSIYFLSLLNLWKKEQMFFCICLWPPSMLFFFFFTASARRPSRKFNKNSS